MPIEALFIIPVVAVSLLILIIILSTQKKREREQTIDRITQNVELYNSGDLQNTNNPEMVKTIDLVSRALSSQQRIIEGFQGKDSSIEQELKEMKSRLLEIQNEYDIVTSENFTLKARLREAGVKFETRDTDEIPVVSRPKKTRSRSMLDDTRTYHRKNIEGKE